MYIYAACQVGHHGPKLELQLTSTCEITNGLNLTTTPIHHPASQGAVGHCFCLNVVFLIPNTPPSTCANISQCRGGGYSGLPTDYVPVRGSRH